MDAVKGKRTESGRAFTVARDSDPVSLSSTVNFDLGSFRDRSARVFDSAGQIYRALTSDAFSAWKQVSNEPFFQRRMAAGQIVQTDELTLDERLRFSFPAEIAGVLKHERIPFISYPYEWPFAMLRKAALLHLEILADAVRAGVMLKDASPYNVQFRGTQPVFIDIGSFIPLVPGEPWLAYRQFCELLLFPLLLQAYRGVDFHGPLRAQLEGIPAKQFLQWMRWRDIFRPGVFTNAWLHATLERNTQETSASTVRDLQASGFQSQLIEQMLKKLTGIVERLKWVPERTQWAQYDNSLPHVADDARTKGEFVRQVCELKFHHLIWDLGCNDGRYSLIASNHASTVVAMDQDHGCIERLFTSLEKKCHNILPLRIDLANQSPGQGWRGRERTRLEERGRPDLVLCLGLIHHLVLAANVPLAEVVNWLASLGGEVILEFPTKKDAMVRALLRNKRDQYDDYSQDHLERQLEQYFDVSRRIVLPSGDRTLYHAIPKALDERALKTR